MNRVTLSLCLAVAVVTAVLTSLVWNSLGKPEVSTPVAAVSAPIPSTESPADSSIEKELKALQDTIDAQAQRIQTLQGQIADLSVEPVRVESTAPQKSYMNQLEEEDPERHQRILERLKKNNDKTVQAIADAADFLFNLDMSLMTPEQQQNHQQLLELLEDSWAQVDRMQESPDGPEFDAAQTLLHKNVRAMKKAFQPEREIALEQWLQRQGFSGEQAMAMRTEIEEVYTKTEPANILPGTQFIGDNMMISVQQMDEGENTQSISLNFDGTFPAE